MLFSINLELLISQLTTRSSASSTRITYLMWSSIPLTLRLQSILSNHHCTFYFHFFRTFFYLNILLTTASFCTVSVIRIKKLNLITTLAMIMFFVVSIFIQLILLIINFWMRDMKCRCLILLIQIEQQIIIIWCPDYERDTFLRVTSRAIAKLKLEKLWKKINNKYYFMILLLINYVY